jgi:hypothetical protein
VPHVLPLTGNVAELVFVNDNAVAAALPVFATVIDCWVLEVPGATVPKFKDVGVAAREAVGDGVPVPEIAIAMVLPPPVIAYVAFAVTAAVGLYVNTTVQVVPALSVAPLHVPDRVKFAGAAG